MFSSFLDDEADTQTEGEELAKARELRMQEVKLRPMLCAATTDTETEVSFLLLFLIKSRLVL